MKKISKLMSVLLALAFCLSLAPAALAATVGPDTATPEGTGTITVTNANLGKQYTAYRLFDASLDTTGKLPDGENIAYTATEDQKLFWVDTNHTTFFNFVKTGYEDKYNVTAAEGLDAEALALFISAHLGEVDKFVLGQTDPVEPDEHGKVVFADLPYGYYFVTSTVGSVITIDSTTPNAKVIDKNQEPAFDKTMDGVEGKVTENSKELPANDRNIGDVIPYTITVDATNYDGEDCVRSYYIVDELEHGLRFAATADDTVSYPVKITFDLDNNAANNNDIDITNDPAYAYTLTWYDGDEKLNEFDPERADSFSVYFPWTETSASFTTDGDFKENFADFRYPANVKITITYRGIVDDDAATGNKGNRNTAKFWLSKQANHDPEEPPPPPPPPPPGKEPDPSDDSWTDEGEKQTITYTYGLAVFKFEDGPDTKPLPGAEFEITFGEPLEGDTDAVTEGKEGKKVSATWDQEKNYYIFAGLVGEGETPKEGATTTFISDKDGRIVLKGIDRGRYTVAESKAPAGYNRVEAFDIVADTVIGQSTESYSYATKWYIKKNEKGEIIASSSETVENYGTDVKTFDFDVEAMAYAVIDKRGNVMPSTGGIGTTIFYVLGGGLAVAALVLLVVKKRMNNKD